MVGLVRWFGLVFGWLGLGFGVVLGGDFGRSFEVSGEGLFSRDFRLSQWGIGYGHDYGRVGWDVGLVYDWYDLDLRSPDPFFEAVSVSEDRRLGELGVRWDFWEGRLVWRGTGSYYEGFQNFRGLWLHEYYRQVGLFFEEVGFGGYPGVSPRGYQLGSQLRWEYLGGSGFLEVGFGYYKDWIAPSAEFATEVVGADGGLVRETVLGRGVIDSFSYRLASENLLGRRVRSLLALQLTDTVARERRFGVQWSVNVALGERWVVRDEVGWVRERPQFRAFFLGKTVEYELGGGWLLSVFGRYYGDSGEVQNSLPLSNAPPGLDSFLAGLGVRWVGGRSSFKVSGGPYWTRYDAVEDEAPFFEDLYRSRDWGMVQLAYGLQF